MRAVVTGGAGFIGSHLVEALQDEGWQVTVIDNLERGRAEQVPEGASFYQLDVRSPELIKAVADAAPRVVFHLAAQVDVSSSLRRPSHDAEVNIIGTLNLLEACRVCGVAKVVYAGSAAVYGDPAHLPVGEDHPVVPGSCYGISKHTVEHYLSVYRACYGLDYTVLRYANVYGPRQDATGEGGVVAIFADKLAKGEVPVIFGDGGQTRDFIYVEDVCRANCLAAEHGGGCILNVSSGTETTINQLYEMMARLCAVNSPPVYAPERPGDIYRSVLDNTRAKQVLGWTPRVPLEEGLRLTMEWYGSTGGHRKLPAG